MDRMEEFRELRGETPAVPPRLEGTLARAGARLRAHRRHVRAAVFPCAFLTVFLAAFTVMVNFSAAFAHACGAVPVLGDLAGLVAFSPSMRAAVENNAVQVVDDVQTKNGVTLGIRYVIADGKQLYLFYSLEDRQNRRLTVEPTLRGRSGDEKLPAVCSSSEESGGGGLRTFVYDFAEGKMPDSLLLDCAVSAGPAEGSGSGKSTVASFTFSLRFDPALTHKEERVDLGTKFSLGGQSFTLSRAEIYPTGMRIFTDGAENNTAWLLGLQFYVTDEKGRRYDTVNGITATGGTGSPAMNGFRCESPYFSGARHLSVHVTGAELLDKAMRSARVDLKNASAEGFPQGVSLAEAKRQGNGWRLVFTARYNVGDAMYAPFGFDYFDSRGSKREFGGIETLKVMRTDPRTGNQAPDPNVFQSVYTLENYTDNEVFLTPEFSRYAKLEEPVTVPVK